MFGYRTFTKNRYSKKITDDVNEDGYTIVQDFINNHNGDLEKSFLA